MPDVTYNPSPTLARFHASQALVRGVRGPIGSGKSVGCCWEIWTRACEQRKSPDGVRRSRWLVTRNTYGELTSTTLKTWLDWFPEERFGKVVHGAPITHTLTWKLGDGSTVELEVLFLALDRPDHVKKLLSLEITGGWMNEAREQPKAILDALTGRVGRYPRGEDGGCTWYGVILDTNPPDDDHWWYTLAEVERPTDFEFFAQPAGDSDQAENLDWLVQTPETLQLPVGHPDRLAQGRRYYERIKAGKTDEWIKVYVKGQYGSVFDGKPVYPEWNDTLHCKALEPLPGVKITIGLDFGLTPAAVFVQQDARGRLLVIDELCGEDMAIRQFVTEVLMPHLEAVYPSWLTSDEPDKLEIVADPAGEQRSQTDERSCFDEVRAAKLPIRAAKSNAWLARRGAVAWFLSRLHMGQPTLILDGQACPVLRKGFNGAYKYRRLKVAGAERYTDDAEKNAYSHCFTGETMVAVPGGERPISEIKVGDLVLTQKGPRPVSAVMSRDCAEVGLVKLSDGRFFYCTADHPVIVNGLRVRADELQYRDVLQTIGEAQWEDRSSIRRRISMALGSIGSLAATTSRMTAGTCTALFGRNVLAPSRMGTMSIIGMNARATMTLATWNACHDQSTSPATADSECRPGVQRPKSTWTRFALPQANGTNQKKAVSGTQSTAQRHGLSVQVRDFCVRTAARHLIALSAQTSAVFALLLASLTRAAKAVLTTRRAHAEFAERGLPSTATQRQERAVAVVGKWQSAGRAKVYDLTVEDAHCFYAAGVLVGNCHDALQYAALEYGGIKAITMPAKRKASAAEPPRPSPGTGTLG